MFRLFAMPVAVLAGIGAVAAAVVATTPDMSRTAHRAMPDLNSESDCSPRWGSDRANAC